MLSRYYGVLLIKFREAFAYRFDYFVKIATNLITLFIIWYVWKAIFAASTGAMSGFTFDSMMIYMSLTIALNWLFSSFEEYNMEFEVRSGAIAMYLIKPISYPITCFFRGIGSRISTTILQVFPFLLVAVFLVKLSWPVSWWFFPSIVFSYLIGFSLVFMTGLWAFYSSGHIWGIRLSRQMIQNVFSGALIPLVFFPQWLMNIANVLPFIAIIHIPVSIYLGNISGSAILPSIGLQIFWAVIMIGLSGLLWMKTRNKIFVQGG